MNISNENMNRYNKGLTILNHVFPELDFLYLGEGKSSVVFTDEKSVYKLFILEEYESLVYKRKIVNNIRDNLKKFEDSSYFFPIYNILEIDKDCFILIYRYEKSEPCEAFVEEEIQGFLVECWQKKLIFQDIKPDNFVRVNKNIKLIDCEPDKFNDNLFLNMVARAFIFSKYSKENASYVNKLCRSAINNFDLPELADFQRFANKIFAKIIYNESKNDIKKCNSISRIENNTDISIKAFQYKDEINFEELFWSYLKTNNYITNCYFENININESNYFSPETIIIETKKISKPREKVSLLIKTCIQDAEIIREATKHIVKQLSFPNSFDEIILSLDIRKNNFLREYNPNNSWEELIKEAEKLCEENIIDRYIYPNDNDIKNTNKTWFDINTKASHTTKGVPVTSQLFSFDQAKNDYILQIDSDVIIGRLSYNHSFLEDMITEMENNGRVISVGFNIFKGEHESFTPYFGFDHNSFVPEVRFCLLKKSRIKQILPLKNEIIEDSFILSWYRSLEQKQKEENYYSIRGGDSRSFFIHPQNFKKNNKNTWFNVVDRVEEKQIPDIQISQFDLSGSYYDWTIPKRNENLVVISCFRNIPLSRFLRFWYSLISQTKDDWGLVLIDDASDNGIHYFIKDLIKPYKHKVTFLRNHFQEGIAQNTYKAIHYYMKNKNSIVCILDADDALIGNRSLKNIYEKYTYWGADVVIGKMYRTDKIHAHYKYTPNFTNPRLYGGNVWQHIRSFKKYLFDSLSFYDLKIKNKSSNLDDFTLSKRFSEKMKYPEYCWDFAYMVPIIEMSESPMCINHFNLFHDRTTINTIDIKNKKENEIAEILSKPRKSKSDILRGRKTFLPNLNQIEIDITYDCNLKCLNCNRSSTQAPTKKGMTLGQIETFIEESINLKKKWKLINILGGEPTLHPDFINIVNLILTEYIQEYSENTILQITSNGYGDTVKKKLSNLPKHKNLIIDTASFKSDRSVGYFSPFNEAPIDKNQEEYNEYYKGCWVTSYCGIGLNYLGYYPCSVSGGIDRIFNFNLGISSLYDVDEEIAKGLNTFCRYCGNFLDYKENNGDFIPRHEKAELLKPLISETWNHAYRTYNKKKVE